MSLDDFWRSYADPTVATLSGRAFIFTELRENITEPETYAYSFTAPANKHVIIYARRFKAAEGPISLTVKFNPTSFTAGAKRTAGNLMIGRPSAQTVITAGVTNVVGGTPESNVEYEFTAGNNTATSQPIANQGLPTIIMPGTTAIIYAKSLGSGSSAGYWLSLGFVEQKIPAHIYGG